MKPHPRGFQSAASCRSPKINIKHSSPTWLFQLKNHSYTSRKNNNYCDIYHNFLFLATPHFHVILIPCISNTHIQRKLMVFLWYYICAYHINWFNTFSFDLNFSCFVCGLTFNSFLTFCHKLAEWKNFLWFSHISSTFLWLPLLWHYLITLYFVGHIQGDPVTLILQ